MGEENIIAIRKLVTAVVALSLGVGVAAGTGVADPVDVAESQVCDPTPENVTQDVENLSQDRVFDDSDDDRNLTVRHDGTDGEKMTVVDSDDLTSLAVEEISNDVCGSEPLAEHVGN